jgi:hypothetical protein
MKSEKLSSIIGRKQKPKKGSEIRKFIIDYWRETETKKGSEIGKFIIDYWRETETKKGSEIGNFRLLAGDRNHEIRKKYYQSIMYVLRLLQKIMRRYRTETEKGRPYYKYGNSFPENLLAGC